jgi:hypothetical protein
MMERNHDIKYCSRIFDNESIRLPSESETETETEDDDDGVKVNVQLDRNTTTRVLNHLRDLDVFVSDIMDWAKKAKKKD